MNEADLAKRIAGLSPEKLALLMRQLNKTSPAQAAVGAQPERPSGPLPLSFAQQRLWFLDQLEPGSTAYNLVSALRLQGPLHVAALEQSLNQVVQRHESLRTTFTAQAEDRSQPVQVVASQLTLTIRQIDLQQVAPGQRDAEIQRLATEAAQQPFDLQRGPLIRATLLALHAREHVLLLTLHHIISDGWSTGVLIRDLSALYIGLAQGAPVTLPPLVLQYADFAQWQRQHLQAAELERQLGYWRDRLSGSLPVLDLPIDRPRPPVQTFRGAKQSFTIQVPQTQALRSLAQRERTSLFTVVLAAFQVLLARYTGQSDIIVGAPIANRTRREIEDLIGCFVNTLVLRADLSGDPSFVELIGRAHETVVGAQDHQDLPFERLLEMLQPTRDVSRTPIFQVLFAFQNTPLPSIALPQLSIEALDVTSHSAKFDLEVNLWETPQGLRGHFEYNVDLFDDATIARMVSHFQTLLAGIVADPQARLHALPLLSSVERQHLLHDWNVTERDYPQAHGQTMHQLFEAQAAYTPDAIALLFDVGDGQPQQLSYRELNTRANQLAHYLRRHGVGPEVRVGLCLERSLELVISIFGVLKAGGAYVPLDPAYPTERLQFMLADARATVLLTQQALMETIPALGRVPSDPTEAHQPPIICLDTAWPMIAAEPEHNPANLTDPANLIYAIYTSGSTGRPKGALNTHQGVCNRILWMQAEYGLTAADRVLQKTPFSFDVSVWEFFWPLITGARLVIARPEGHKDSSYLVRLIREQQITTLHFVPSMLQIFLETAELETCISMRRVICSGEALPYELQARFFARLEAELHNLYGPTEAAVDVTAWACQPDFPRRIVPIGRPVANTQMYVLDAWMQPVPVGVPGDLYIGGVQLARGYLDRPALTAERFVPNPFSNGRLYKTGDLARYLRDGAIEYLGRTDHQIKLRGFRIELGEIEARLQQHRSIRAAIVILREDEPGEKRLVAYVVGEQSTANDGAGQSPPGPSELIAFLRAELPEYMIPSAFVALPMLPLTPNGKIDRQALPAPDRSRSASLGRFVAPRTAVQEVIANIWAELLGMEQLSIYDNFFELGGHSLLATQTVSRASNTFSVDVPLRALFDKPTVAGMAGLIEALVEARDGHAVPPITPVARDGHLPLSFAQERLWFIDQLTEGNTAYNTPIAARISGPLDLAALQASFEALARRHETLRTTFHSAKGQPYQVILAPDEFKLAWSVMDVQHLPEQERDPYGLRIINEAAQQPFDLQSGPLFRVLVLRLDPETHLLLLLIHHSIYDLMSGDIFIRETRTLYESFVSGSAPALPEMPVQYADFASWQRQSLQGSVLAEQLDYWRTQLAGATTVLDLPTDRLRPEVQTYNGAHQEFELSLELSRQLKALARQEDATTFMLLLASFNVLLYRYSVQEDILVGTPIANRNRYEIENLIGFFVNTLVLRTDLGGNPSFREVLGRVRETALGAYAHQNLPFEKVVEAALPNRDPSRNPLFQVMFSFLHSYIAPISGLGDVSVEAIRLHSDRSQFDLALECWENHERLLGSFDYNTDLFDAETMTRFASHLETLLTSIVADPDQPINILQLHTVQEQQQIDQWVSTPAVARAAEQTTLHRLFEARAQQTPDACALVYGDLQLSYRALNERAEQLARYLHTLGVGQPGSIRTGEACVGLYFERSLDLVVAMLGTLKAGAAYVPLDPSYPPERLQFILQDTHAAVLLTQQDLGEIPQQVASQIGLHLTCLDTDWPTIAAASTPARPPTVYPEQLAYVIYTSGSTGAPKGVGVSHGAAASYCATIQHTFALTANDRVLVFASAAFDVFVEELFPTLLAGATAVLRGAELWPPAEFSQVLERQAISVINLPPAYWQQWLEAQEGSPARPPLDALRLMVVGSDVLPPIALAHWQGSSLRPVRLINGYGPTEVTVAAVMAQLSGDDPTLIGRSVPIGRPLPARRALILDAYGNQLPAGVPGELYLGGNGLARGYVRQPALTAERFVPDPWSAVAGARLYRTGDRARWRADGQIEFLGRADDQIKLRGFRIEPNEIAATLGRHPAVADAAVVACADQLGEPRLVAYIVAHADQAPVTAELRAFLIQRLPEYMVPSAFVSLESLPRTTSGKVNRRALPVPENLASDLEAAFVAPRTSLEQALADTWCAVLRQERVGIYDNFFELGGHSLLATQIVARLYDDFQVELPLRNLFDHPTIAELAAMVTALRQANPTAQHALADPEAIEEGEI